MSRPQRPEILVGLNALLLGHLDGHGPKIVQKLFAAHGPSAGSETAQHLRFVPDADLPKLDPGLEHVRKILHQLPEIHPVVRGEIEHHLAAGQVVLHVHQLHIEAVLRYLLLADGEGFLLLVPVVLPHAQVLVGGDPLHGLEGRDHLVVLHLRDAHGHVRVLHAPGRLHHDPLARLDIEIARVEIVDPAAVPEFNSDYLYHCFPTFSKTPASRPAGLRRNRRTPSAPAAFPVLLLSYIEFAPL